MAETWRPPEVVTVGTRRRSPAIRGLSLSCAEARSLTRPPVDAGPRTATAGGGFPLPGRCRERPESQDPSSAALHEPTTSTFTPFVGVAADTYPTALGVLFTKTMTSASLSFSGGGTLRPEKTSWFQ